MSTTLNTYQLTAIEQLKTGSILCGGVGTGKSRTALAYYVLKECDGCVKINGSKEYLKFKQMKKKKDLYIITTAKKRDSFEWLAEAASFGLSDDRNAFGVIMKVDSWNNIGKYVDIKDAFFIFDEQRLVGYGSWVKSFLKIAKNNHWILLSATPGDQWTDYIPVFVANCFYKNKTEFNLRHCVFKRFSKYPIIERYIDEAELLKHRDQITVELPSMKKTKRLIIPVYVDYDRNKYRRVMKDRWNIYEEEPIQDISQLLYTLRKIVNTDNSRYLKVKELIDQSNTSIVFYNFNYELEILRRITKELKIASAEWNGQNHNPLPIGERWTYLVQYSAGCEGWNCITTNNVIFYSLNYSYRIMEQAKGRIDRMNTPFNHLHYYMIRSQAPIDLAINRALIRKQNFNEKSFVTKT